jgi:pSer/pThr/pTyr-binding forkhead associated (FHA) protein
MFIILRIVRFQDPKDLNSPIDFQYFVTVKYGQEITIGRSKFCNQVINDDFCSSEHCIFSFRDDLVFVRDNESKNGTKLNGVRIYKDELIEVKDVVHVGKTIIHIDEDKTPTGIIKLLGENANEKTVQMATRTAYLDIESISPRKKKKEN